MLIHLCKSTIPISAEIVWRSRFIRFETTDEAIVEHNGSPVVMNVKIDKDGKGYVYGTFRPWDCSPLKERFIEDAEKIWAQAAKLKE